MAEAKRMTAEQVVAYLLEGEEGLDFLRVSLRWVVQQLMEAEVSELVGADRRRARRAQPGAADASQRLSAAPLGHARRRARARDPEDPARLVLPELMRVQVLRDPLAERQRAARRPGKSRASLFCRALCASALLLNPPSCGLTDPRPSSR
jgi:hypothetical protein